MPPHAPPVAAEESSAVEEPSFEFDGHRFGITFWQAAPLLYMAKKARDGDSLAAELLNGFTIKLTDADGKVYWPVA